MIFSEVELYKTVYLREFLKMRAETLQKLSPNYMVLLLLRL